MRAVYHEKSIVLAATLAVSVTLLFSPSFVRSDVPVTTEKATGTALPRMLDLGRNQCMPCKMMAPVLAELKREYAGVVDIEYINVAENPDAMKKLGLALRAVPFQIFYDASGKIVKRHYGYMSKQEILEAFKALGFDRKKPPSAKQ
jgi:thioredoxin 1